MAGYQDIVQQMQMPSLASIAMEVRNRRLQKQAAEQQQAMMQPGRMSVSIPGRSSPISAAQVSGSPLGDMAMQQGHGYMGFPETPNAGRAPMMTPTGIAPAPSTGSDVYNESNAIANIQHLNPRMYEMLMRGRGR